MAYFCQDLLKTILMPEIKNANFIKSSTELKDCPTPHLPEYVFIGRSNVGKSSLINMLCNHKKLAKTSSTPGKTTLINHFLIDDSWYLVDLPGYGYARTSKVNRAAYKKMIFNYIENRRNLVNVFVLVDSRHTPQQVDLEFMEWLGKKRVPFSLVFTKLDKLSSSELVKNLQKYTRKFLEHWESLPKTFRTSSIAQTGKDDLTSYIQDLNEQVADHILESYQASKKQ
jgi:GTP-binding protein